MKKIKIYTSETCPHCHSATDYFNEKGIEFEELKTEDSKNAEEAQKISGQTGVPVIDIEGKIIIGFDAEKIDEALN
jgi:glutaredoxin 3